MKFQIFLLLCLCISIASPNAEAYVKNKKEEAKLLEELTGKKTQTQAAVGASKTVQNKNNTSAVKHSAVPVSRRLLDAGFHAYKKKDYITALKYYNTVIAKYPKSKELPLAYLAKSKMYQEMGLNEQAQLNYKKANELGKKTALNR